ncbi:acyl-CoA synthetase [uncultured Sphingorhabdus sp.]|uniref:acyl-CoA synthetase n=1 Tax=uncultured Sphingorhabdus sp. TaxID=1686106 RepID=UPI00260953B3|nr:acyl-CoA synthetase [uncultured Sphingorhabdus sp.]HMS20958.1 acyl-CoA synthetase [Sphingorhabdus sp.]
MATLDVFLFANTIGPKDEEILAMTEWTYASMWESIAAAIPEKPAIVQQDLVMSWQEFDRAANGLAAYLVDGGLGRQAKVAVYARNCPEYLIGTYAAFKASLVPFNVNYRYGNEELAYLFENGDAEAVLFETVYAEKIDAIRDRLPGVKLWIAIKRSGYPIPHWAVPYSAIAPADSPPEGNGPRSSEDQMFIYTGGTTGMPKAVMWRQGDLIGKGGYGSNPLLGIGPMDHPGQSGQRALEFPIPVRMLIGPPLMHGTGLLSAFAALSAGGTVLLNQPDHFDAVESWNLAEKWQATWIIIVGQPFAQPLLDALDAEPGRWDLKSVLFFTSSGAMWNEENKRGLLRHMPQAALMDAFSSSEALGLGTSVTTAAETVHTAEFALGEDCAVFDEDGNRVQPGSGVRGRVAVGGFIPVGYYKDPVKSASTFLTIEGQRWSVPGDWALVNEDGSLTLLGRGSQCINTGGEKVFPEEVEEALKRHPAVVDAAVCGLPDPRFGERVAAVASLKPGAVIDQRDLIDHVRGELAHYKAPRHLLFVDTVPRAPNGKMDYAEVKRRAAEAFAVS